MEIHVINPESTLKLEIVIEDEDKSIELGFSCINCLIDFKFLDNENYQKFSSNQSYESRLVLNNWDTYSNRIFIPYTGSWWVIFINTGSEIKEINFTYFIVDPPITEDWIFWIILIPWLIGFFVVVVIWFRTQNKKKE